MVRIKRKPTAYKRLIQLEHDFDDNGYFDQFPKDIPYVQFNNGSIESISVDNTIQDNILNHFIDEIPEYSFDILPPSFIPTIINKQPMNPQPEEAFTPIHVIRNRRYFDVRFNNDFIDDDDEETTIIDPDLASKYSEKLCIEEPFYDPESIQLPWCRPTKSSDNGFVASRIRIVDKPPEKIIHTSKGSFQRLKPRYFLQELCFDKMEDDFRLLQFITGIEIEGNTWHSPNDPNAVYQYDLLRLDRHIFGLAQAIRDYPRMDDIAMEEKPKKEEEVKVEEEGGGAGHGGHAPVEEKEDEPNLANLSRYVLFTLLAGGIYFLMFYLLFFKQHHDFDNGYEPFEDDDEYYSEYNKKNNPFYHYRKNLN